MRIFSLAFLFGILWLQNYSQLPNKNIVYVIVVLYVIFIFFPAKIKKFITIPMTCALGFAWCLWFAYAQTVWTLPKNLEGKTISVTGYISSIPSTEFKRTAFLFSLNKVQFEKSQHSAQGLLRLSSQFEMKNLHVGDKWEFTVRLKKIHGTSNPGGFDYEAWALQSGIRANGYIIDKAKNTFISSHWYHHPIDRCREFLKEKIERNLPVSNTSPWIVALTVGERHGISPENWEVLRNTGTNHLMAIAGLHIGFMSGFVYAIVAWLWRRSSRLSLYFPAPHAGSVAALLMALIYSSLAGFSIPTQRACLMLTVFMIIILLRRKVIAWQAWSIALIVVLLINPLSVLTESFWLSFGAVALIIYGVSARLSPTGLWWKLGRIQWVIAFGLIPFGIWLFQQCSIISFPANSIAIPWLGFLVVPLCLLGAFLLLFSSTLGGLVLTLADKVLSVLWVILTWFAHLSWGNWYLVMPNHFILIAACVGMIILLLPIGFPGRYLGIVGLLPLFFYVAPTPNTGEVWFTLLDVGQGLSAVVQTKQHILVFDAGPKMGASFDMGESVVVPFLRTIGAKKVDMLVVSHGDNDHIGGAAAIQKRFTVASIKTSVPDDLPSSSTSYCLRGESWRWDGVSFEFLYPVLANLGLNNDSSCVLRVSVGNKHILLTGDIEKLAEKNLVDFEKMNLAADIIVAPHHGSKTSAENDFLQAVKPLYVLFPIGYRNRYHFPHVSVIEKYTALNSKQLDTVHSGAIKFTLQAHELLMEPVSYRLSAHHYWND